MMQLSSEHGYCTVARSGIVVDFTDAAGVQYRENVQQVRRTQKNWSLRYTFHLPIIMVLILLKMLPYNTNTRNCNVAQKPLQSSERSGVGSRTVLQLVRQ